MASLQRGSKGSDVQELQTALNAAGANPALDVDGDFGPLTETAVRAFQSSHGLRVDGVAGPETIQALLHAADTAPPVDVSRDNTMAWVVGAGLLAAAGLAWLYA